MAVWLCVLGPLQTAKDVLRWGSAIALCLFSWVWWSLVTPPWRSWALRSGVDAESLYRWGRRTGLVSRKGSIFEKTEIYLPERTFYGLLGGLLVVTFLTIETLLSNYFEEVVSLTEPFSSLVAAAICAVILWPIHNGLRGLLRGAQKAATSFDQQ